MPTSIAHCTHNIEPELIRCIGAKCGSSYIDLNFKRWLRKILGDKLYRTLDPNIVGRQITSTMEGKLVRQVVQAFDMHKKKFKNAAPEVKFNLPQEDRNAKAINVPGKVKEGELTITQ